VAELPRDSLLGLICAHVTARSLGHPVRVAVDGITASGKSTWADALADRVRANGRAAIRISMDGFHHRRERRHRQGRLSADGYYEDAYDLATAARDLLAPLGPGGTLRYRERAIDLATDRAVEDAWQIASPDAVLIVDGSFLQRPELRGLWDEVVYLDVPFDVAMHRGLRRDAAAFGGEHNARTAFEHRYHAAGRRYLRDVDPARRATVVVDNTDFDRPVLRRLGVERTRRAHPAGDVDYERHGTGYAVHRRPDPRIASVIHAALGDARTVLNVGAGAGSYEPDDRYVVAVEPSAAMRAQRPTHRVPAVDAVAERLPFAAASFDAAMATITVHQWRDLDAGLRELRRVSRGVVAIVTADGPALTNFWLADYVPDLITGEQRRFPPIEHIVGVLGGTTDVVPIPIPHDCVDGFAEAYYARPEAFLDADVRASQSAWTFLDPAVVAGGLSLLADDLATGAWDRTYGHLRAQPAWLGALRLIIARP
jgi:uridine kinase